METSAIPRGPRTMSRGRGSGREPGGVTRTGGAGHDEQYDLLTAALLGLAVGVGTTLLLRRGPSGHRPVSPVLRGAMRGAQWAGMGAARLGARGAAVARHAGSDLWEHVPREEIQERVHEYLGRARETIDEAVASEVRDLRRAIRRRRKRLGI